MRQVRTLECADMFALWFDATCRRTPSLGGEKFMRPADIQIIGNELAVKWDDDSESFIPLEILRRCCPCADCQGETDVLGNVYKGPERLLTPPAFELVRLVTVGGYAIQPVWADGHATGIYSFDYLRRIAGEKK